MSSRAGRGVATAEAKQGAVPCPAHPPELGSWLLLAFRTGACGACLCGARMLSILFGTGAWHSGAGAAESRAPWYLDNAPLAPHSPPRAVSPPPGPPSDGEGGSEAAATASVQRSRARHTAPRQASGDADEASAPPAAMPPLTASGKKRSKGKNSGLSKKQQRKNERRARKEARGRRKGKRNRKHRPAA